MALEVLDIRYGQYKKQLHDLIILVLAKEYPLKIGEIGHRLKTEFNVEISFQAVRKSLNAMVGRKILVLKERSYGIEKNYGLELKRLSDQVMKNYFSGGDRSKSPPIFKKDDISTYEFENLIQADQFVNDITFELIYDLKEGDDRTFVFNGPHMWYVFAHPGLEQAFLEGINAHGVTLYNLVTGNTKLDRWEKKFYEKHAHYKTHPDHTPMKTVINVFAGHIIQYDYPEELYGRMEQFYQETKDLESLDLEKIADIMKFKTKIKVIVMRNKTIAQKLKEEILSKFKKE